MWQARILSPRRAAHNLRVLHCAGLVWDGLYCGCVRCATAPRARTGGAAGREVLALDKRAACALKAHSASNIWQLVPTSMVTSPRRPSERPIEYDAKIRYDGSPLALARGLRHASNKKMMVRPLELACVCAAVLREAQHPELVGAAQRRVRDAAHQIRLALPRLPASTL